MTKCMKVFLLFSMCLVQTEAQDCPTWFYKDPSGECVCGQVPEKDTIYCNPQNKKVSISPSYCMTYDKGSVHFGKCPYSGHKSVSMHGNYIISVPSNVLEINSKMCGPLNRTGLLCGECVNGTGPAVFSLYRECKECIAYPWGWLLFIARVTIPLTFMCAVVIIFRINVASPNLNGIVLAIQIINSMIDKNPYYTNDRAKLFEGYRLNMFVIDVYGLFSLDFFRCLIPSFCISKDMSMLTVIALDYVVAFYPILVTVVVYLLITMHDSGFRIIVYCWRPFHKCFVRYRKSWNIKGSVLNAFTTFVLLSVCKFIAISTYLLQSTQVWQVKGKPTNVVYFEADKNTLSLHFTQFRYISIIITFIMVFPATFILLFYQNKYFQKLLDCLRMRCTIVNELAKIVQGSFKDGTTPGSRDYRWFAGVYLLLRIILICALFSDLHVLIIAVLTNVMCMLVACMRPYKNEKANYFESFLWLISSIGTSIFLYEEVYKFFNETFIAVLSGVPLYFILGVVVAKVISAIKKWCKSALCQKKDHPLIPPVNESVDDHDFPDRLINPGRYGSLNHAV